MRARDASEFFLNLADIASTEKILVYKKFL